MEFLIIFTDIYLLCFALLCFGLLSCVTCHSDPLRHQAGRVCVVPKAHVMQQPVGTVPLRRRRGLEPRRLDNGRWPGSPLPCGGGMHKLWCRYQEAVAGTTCFTCNVLAPTTVLFRANRRHRHRHRRPATTGNSLTCSLSHARAWYDATTAEAVGPSATPPPSTPCVEPPPSSSCCCWRRTQSA